MASSTTPQTHKENGNAFLRNKKYAEAIEEYTKAINLDGTQHVFYCNRAAARLHLAALDSDGGANSSKIVNEASADAQRCIDLNKEYAKGYLQKSNALLVQKNWGAAAAVLRAGVEACKEQTEKVSLMQSKLSKCEKRVEENSWKTLLFGAPGFSDVPIQFFIVFSALMYLLPITPRGMAQSSYRRTILLSVVSTFFALYKTYGRPQFSKQYAAQVIQDQRTLTLMLAALLYSSRPTLLGLVPLVSLEFVRLALFFHKVCSVKMSGLWKPLASRFSGWATSLIAADGVVSNWASLNLPQKSYQFLERLQAWNTYSVVALGFFRIVEAFTPYRSMIGTLMLWQYLRMVLMIEQTRPMGQRHAAAAFGIVDRKISSVVDRCPGFVGTGYSKLKGFLGSMTQLPAAGDTSSSSMCSIM